MLLLDGVDGHANISHPVSMARRHHVGAFIGETVVSVEKHDHVSESHLVDDWAPLVLESEVIEEVIDCLDTLLGAEQSSWPVN